MAACQDPDKRPCFTAPFYEGDDDVLDVDVLVQIPACAQEVAQRLQVVVIRENLQGKRTG